MAHLTAITGLSCIAAFNKRIAVNPTAATVTTLRLVMMLKYSNYFATSTGTLGEQAIPYETLPLPYALSEIEFISILKCKKAQQQPCDMVTDLKPDKTRHVCIYFFNSQG